MFCIVLILTLGYGSVNYFRIWNGSYFQELGTEMLKAHGHWRARRDMLIMSLKQHFPARLPEWFMAGMLVMWGGYLIFHPEVFTQPATARVMSGLAAMAGELPPAAMWGLSAVIVGMVRGSALFINGAYARTPLVRLITSFASAFVFTQVVIGLIKSGVANAGLPVYAGLVVLDIVSAYRAATDTVYAEKARHDTKQELRRVQHRSLA